MNNDWAFLPMREANDLLDDPPALQSRLAEDGYLLFRQLINRDTVDGVYDAVASTLEDVGWISRNKHGRPASLIRPIPEGDEAYFEGYDAVQRLEAFHSLAHDEALTSAMTSALAGPVFPHPLKIARLIFPRFDEFSTPPHQDYPNNQGSEHLTAAWIPLHDLPAENGGIAVLRGSNRYGPLPVTGHLGPGNRCAVVPDQMQEECRWVTTTFEQGDVLIFGALTVHAATHNASELFMRLSVDFRFQREGEALTEICLEPHFQRLDWDEIYSTWKSERFQRYWLDHHYEVVPFEELPLASELSDAEFYRLIVDLERRVNARFAGGSATTASAPTRSN